MFIKTKEFEIFLIKKFFPLNIIVLYTMTFLIKVECSKQFWLSREETTPQKVAPEIIRLINENYDEKNGENKVYNKDFGEYSLELKFLYLNFNPEEINIDIYITGLKFFSYVDIYLDLIFSLKLTRNQNNIRKDEVSILYNSKTNSSDLSFQLKKSFSTIYIKNIDFDKQPNNTYKYKIPSKPEVIIETTFDYPEKINKFLIKNEKEIGLFLFESFDNYLTNITDHFPKADGILIYEAVVIYLNKYRKFSLSKNPNYSDKTIFFNEFKEEKIYEQNGAIVFSNITIKFDILIGSYIYKSYEEVIPYIEYINDDFYFNAVNTQVGDLQLKAILKFIFDFIINYYTYNY